MKLKYRFCWWCSKQLHGNAHRTVKMPSYTVIVHVSCEKPAAAYAQELMP